MSNSSIPELVKHDTGFELVVDGEPFLMLGAQVHNSSGTGTLLESAFEQLSQLGANTLEVPIYWSELEPIEGAFDFSPARRGDRRRSVPRMSPGPAVVRHLEERHDGLRPGVDQVGPGALPAHARPRWPTSEGSFTTRD